VTGPADTGREAEDVGGSGAVDWDAASYDQQADPQEQWGREVLERIELAGDETVLDAGCGSGRVTQLIVERVPRGRVVGVDASQSMVELARERLGPDVELIHVDLVDLELEVPVDVVFSNATFHWIANHDLLFSRLHAVLRPGGRLEAQCGGQGNVAEFERAVDALTGDERFAPYLRGERRAWNFASVGDTESRLRRAGFGEPRAWLEPKHVEPSDPREYCRVAALAWHLARLPEDLHDEFVDAVIEMMPRPLVLDYVRLNISAVA
jgi:trans-aconitate 2-methyltransferase